MSPDRAYELSPAVAVRTEPFGALAYHYGNRRLTFLRSPEIVAVVRSLADYPSVAAALDGHGIDAGRRGAFHAALEQLENSEMIRARDI